MTIDVSDLNKLAVDLGHASAKVVAGGTKIIAKTAYDIEGDGKTFCPVDTGFLKNSISTDVRGLSAEIGPTADYAPFVEDGTSRMAPEPFMRPAAEKNAPGMFLAFEQLTRNIL